MNITDLLINPSMRPPLPSPHLHADIIYSVYVLSTSGNYASVNTTEFAKYWSPVAQAAGHNIIHRTKADTNSQIVLQLE